MAHCAVHHHKCVYYSGYFGASAWIAFVPDRAVQSIAAVLCLLRKLTRYHSFRGADLVERHCVCQNYLCHNISVRSFRCRSDVIVGRP